MCFLGNIYKVKKQFIYEDIRHQSGNECGETSADYVEKLASEPIEEGKNQSKGTVINYYLLHDNRRFGN